MERRVRRRTAHLLVATLAGAAALATATISRGPVAHAAPVEESRLTPGPLGGISIIGDSVMLGSLIVDPDLPDRLVEQGWGPVRARAGEGYSTGYFDVPLQFKASHWIRQWRSQGWDPEAVIVNFGANDSGFCETDTICAEAAIRHLVDAIGPGHRILWPKITRFPFHRATQDAWNAALDRIAATTPGFYTWDWPTVMYEVGLYSPIDHIHQSPDGYRERSRRMAIEATLALSTAREIGSPAPLPVATAEPSEMLPVEPTRVLDTRQDEPGRLAAGDVVPVALGDVVPEGSTAVGVYVTAVNPSDAGHVSVAPCADGATYGQTSMLNYPPDTTRGASTIVALGQDSSICVFSFADADIVVDLQTVFVPEGLRFTPTSPPDRLLDTRASGRSRQLEIPVPEGAEVAAVNITVTGSSGPGHITAHPCLAEPPLTAVLNHGPGETIASFAFVSVSDDGTICLDTFADTDVVVDLTGVASSDGELRFVGSTPTRMVDTRDATGGFGFRHGAQQTIETVVAPPEAAAVSGTVTLVAPYAGSFLQAWACGAIPDTSAVNAGKDDVYANGITVAVDGGSLCLRAHAAGSTLFDTTGWWVP